MQIILEQYPRLQIKSDMLSIEIIENEQHIWLECKNNGQAAAWEIARATWEKTTSRLWPNISLRLIRGAASLSFENDYSKNRETTYPDFYDCMGHMEIRNKYSINDQEVAPIERSGTLKVLNWEQVRKSWSAMRLRFMKGNRGRTVKTPFGPSEPKTVLPSLTLK